MIKVTVKLFGPGAAAAAGASHSLKLPDGATVADLVSLLREKNIASGTLLQKSNFVVNETRADSETLLHDGDKVMITFTLGGG